MGDRLIRSRKPNRLESFDYSQKGGYFLTICTYQRKQILSKIVNGMVGDGFHAVPPSRRKAAPIINLTEIGTEIEKTISFLDRENKEVNIEKYVIMPNHIHLIVQLNSDDPHVLTIPKVIGQFKSFTTKRFNDIYFSQGQKLWQRSYYDHIIRDEKDYQFIWDYFDTNPLRWIEDELFNESE